MVGRLATLLIAVGCALTTLWGIERITDRLALSYESSLRAASIDQRLGSPDISGRRIARPSAPRTTRLASGADPREPSRSRANRTPD